VGIFQQKIEKYSIFNLQKFLQNTSPNRSFGGWPPLRVHSRNSAITLRFTGGGNWNGMKEWRIENFLSKDQNHEINIL